MGVPLGERGGQGDYLWTVDRPERIDGVEHYVISTGPREIFLRTSDLATSLERAAARVERRNTPARLASRGRSPRARRGGSATPRRARGAPPPSGIAWKVEGEEESPSRPGRSRRCASSRGTTTTPAVMYEMWYAPEAKQWVRLKEHFPNGVRYRELTALNLRS